MKEETAGWWKRCCMEEEIDGTVEDVLDGRRTGGIAEEVLGGKGTDGGVEQEQTGWGGRGVGWKRKQMGVEEVLDGKGTDGW